MIVTEFYEIREDGIELDKTYSDAGMYILQNETGAKYIEAIDVVPLRYTYSETDEPIPEEPVEPEDLQNQPEL